MAETVDDFMVRTWELVRELHREICDTAICVSKNPPPRDDADEYIDETTMTPRELRKDLLVMVYRALLADCSVLPTYEARYVPKWARGVTQTYYGSDDGSDGQALPQP